MTKLPHDGGPCPVAPETRVRVWLRGGGTFQDCADGFRWVWSERLPDRNILFYEPLDAPRTCTCHPDDGPPVPCAEKYALSECRNAPAVKAGELLPCPFCGGLARIPKRTAEDIATHDKVEWTTAGCTDCNIEFDWPRHGYEEKDSAVAQWNRRASPPAPMPVVDEQARLSNAEIAQDILEIAARAKREDEHELWRHTTIERHLQAHSDRAALLAHIAALTPPSSAEKK